MSQEKEIYKITIDEAYSDGEQDLGWEETAFVKNPAVILKGFAYSEHSKKLVFKDEPKMRITAPAMIPMEIYRNDEAGEYFVEFTEEEIENIFSKFMKNLSNSGKFNIEHNQDNKAEAYILEAWLVDNPKQDKAYSTFGLEVPKGTLMMTAQITNRKLYDELIKNEQTGFSIEGFMGLKMSELKSIEKQEAFSNTQIKNTDMKLPDGKHLIDGKFYVVKNGEVAEVIDETETEMEEVKEEEIVMETEKEEEEYEEEKPESETEMEIVVEDNAKLSPNPGEEEEKFQIDETELMTILQPKFDEIYKMIADLKAAMIVEEEVETEKIEMSMHQRFSNVVNNYIKK
jgi:5-carboxymethyl-2-hydroxymuconate isomerase